MPDLRRRSVILALLVGITTTIPPSSVAAPAGLKRDGLTLRPGLVAEYRSLARKDDPSVVRIDAKPAFTWGTSTPHPRIAPGPFEATWSGVVEWRESHPIHLAAVVGGTVTVTIDATVVLEGTGRKETTRIEATRPFSRAPGLYRIRIRYRSLAGVPARVQLSWEGKSFAREPLPASRLMHITSELPTAVAEEERAARGREAVGRFGCARCHANSFPDVKDAPPGPSLAGLGQRINQTWLMDWLANPARIRPGAHMPALFPDDRRGLVERWLVAEHLLRSTATGKRLDNKPGDHRAGKQAFLGLGCVACHHDPEKPAPSSRDLERRTFIGLVDRLPAGALASFLEHPQTRYPDGRMPKLPISTAAGRDLAAYLLLWSKPAEVSAATAPVKASEVEPVLRRLKVDRAGVGAALVREKGCSRCHDGLGEPTTASVPVLADRGGCLEGARGPRFVIDNETKETIRLYTKRAGQDRYSSPFASRQRLLQHFKCQRCHPREGELASPLEEIGRSIWIPFLYRLPYQRTPRLTQATAKLQHAYLLATIREGVSKVRPDWYSYRMPAFGAHAEEILRALAEGDGDWPVEKPTTVRVNPDPTLRALGPALVGFEGYACVSCHVWEGKSLAAVEPGTVGPEMMSLTRRIRRDWFDRYLDDPARLHPGTPMPAIFRRGEPASMAVLDGDAGRQKDALWAYLDQGTKAPSPKPRPPLPVPIERGGPALVSQIPVQLPDLMTVESICILTASNDAIVYDVSQATLSNLFTGARLLRQANVWRSYQLAGTALLPAPIPGKTDLLTLTVSRRTEQPQALLLQGYERLVDGVRIRWRWRFPSATVEAEDTVRIITTGGDRQFHRQVQLTGLSAEQSLAVQMRVPAPRGAKVEPATRQVRISGGRSGKASGTISFDLPAAQSPPETKDAILTIKPDEGHIGPLERPGYRALMYPRPKTVSGEDLVMPSALAAHPRDGRVFIASMKFGDLFVLVDPHDNGKNARFERYAHGLFQDVFGMLHDGKDLHVLHRRNLSRLRERDTDRRAIHVDRLTGLAHAVGNAYDWGYGLVRDHEGSFLFTFAPHASHHGAGSGSLLRKQLRAEKLDEVAFGFRNPLGWCQGPEGEVFFTDNQGEWVATNKLCHIVPGRFYGYPNPKQAHHARKPMAATTIWVPYDWAKSINGVAYDSAGKFGPFAGQIFLAELMHGGAILRANVEKVNGVYQGACFPFWGRGLLGPLMLTFDAKGRLFVGSITTPGWMGQPDRGALFRLEYTGLTPFEIQSIHVRPQGFRLVFTRSVDAQTARQVASYQIDHHRYEYTGAYGSPEFDRTRLTIDRADVAADGRTVDLTTGPLIKGRVYLLAARGVRSPRGEVLVHPAGAYTLNEIPKR